ncbi:MAG: hypothetical protein ACOCZX_00975 [Candidatus Bipolaricaulota bacterium]
MSDKLKFGLVVLLLGAVDFCVPFFLLKSVPSFLANYLFWCGLTLIVILYGASRTRNWSS